MTETSVKHKQIAGMLRTDLIELINSGDAWAFVGSGVSANAGCPTWKDLVDKTVASFDSATVEKIQNDELYELAYNNTDFSACFSRVEWCVGRRKLVNAVTEIIKETKEPGRITKLLADLPFAGYTTTNYDHLLESALVAEKGWSSVGNLDDELRKLSGGATRVVWHIHGSVEMKDRSRLVLTEKDYDDLYLEDTPAIQQLRALLTQHRMLFVGFSFADREITRLLKRVGKLCNPARPIYAFLSGISGAEHEATRHEFLQKYNVDVIPYRTRGGSHEQLLALLEVYGALVLRRSLRFGQPARECPSYDPETTGLLLYNELVMREGGRPTSDILTALLKSRILSLLKYRGSCTTSDFFDDLNTHASVLQGASVSNGPEVEVGKVLRTLETSGLIQISDEPTQKITLSSKGSNLVDDQSGIAQRMSEQFKASLKARAMEVFAGDEAEVLRIANAAELFLKDCIEHRALGVAMARHARRSDYQKYHMVALLQTLPRFMELLTSEEEAIALSKLVQGILANPSEAEGEYIGLALQAQFGVHLLGYDPDTLRARARDFSNTLFLIDSSTLIPYIARSSVGSDSINLLVNRIKSMGSALATTNLLAHELTEHGQWAVGKVGNDGGQLSLILLQAATGRAGERSNAFVEGYLRERGDGTSSDFLDYLRQVCRLPPGARTVSDAGIQELLNEDEILCYPFQGWEGFSKSLFDERDELQNQIADLREANRTFRHWRQVRAEAEALIVIRNLRDGTFSLNGKTLGNAFFISHTRIIDQVASASVPVTMRPEAALQWVAALTPCSVKELGFLTNSLLLELASRNLSVVDRSRLDTTFYSLLSGSKEKLDEAITTHRMLVSERYGEDAAKAFNDVDLVDTPFVLDSYRVQRVEELERQVKFEQEQRIAAQQGSTFSEKERAEYERLRTEEMRRKRRARSRKRATASKPRKKNKKKASKKARKK